MLDSYDTFIKFIFKLIFFNFVKLFIIKLKKLKIRNYFCYYY